MKLENGYVKIEAKCKECGNSFITIRSKYCSHECRQKQNVWLKHGYARRGEKKTPEYKSWEGMKRRCFYIGNKDYKYYGGRGITVCPQWVNSFEQFISDMGHRPSKKHSIDRINVNGNYEPSNCRWTTQDIQVLNSRITSNETGYRGVSKRFHKGKWFGNYQVLCSQKYFGFTNNLIEAAMLYDFASTSLYGEQAFLNFPEHKELYLERVKSCI